MVECGPPPNITNGQVTYSGITYQSVANYSCEAGYRLEGSEFKSCQDSLLWTPTDTACNSEYIYIIPMHEICIHDTVRAVGVRKVICIRRLLEC